MVYKSADREKNLIDFLNVFINNNCNLFIYLFLHFCYCFELNFCVFLYSNDNSVLS